MECESGESIGPLVLMMICENVNKVANYDFDWSEVGGCKFQVLGFDMICKD